MTVYLSLGANRGDRAAGLAAALAALPRHGIRVERVSAIRETRPEGATGRRAFLNCAVEASTDLLPRVLLGRLRAIEHSLGRRRLDRGRATPRPVDLDLIFYGRARIATATLTVPHPRFARRRFVLDGLAELAPRGRAPGSGLTLRQARCLLMG